MKALILIASLLFTTNCRSIHRVSPFEQDSLNVVQFKVAKIIPDSELVTLLSRFVNQCKNAKSNSTFSFGFSLISNKTDSGYRIVVMPILFPLNVDSNSIFGCFEINGVKIICFGAKSTLFRTTNNFDFIPFISKEMYEDSNQSNFNVGILEFHAPEYVVNRNLQNESYLILVQPCGNN